MENGRPKRISEFTPRPIVRPVVRQQASEPPAPEKHPSDSKQRPRELRIRLPRLRLKLLVACLAIVCLIGTTIFFVTHNLQHDPLPQSIKQKANFTLYYPKYVPPNFRFDAAAYDPTTDVVSYDYSTVDGNKVYFTLQPKPRNFNFDEFRKKQLAGAHQISTPVGAATIGVLQGQTVSSIVTDKTWILIGSGEKVSIDQLEKISQSLAPAK